MRVLYFECMSGISGDMTAASLIDLGVPSELVLKTIGMLPIEGYEIALGRVEKHGISAASFQVHTHEHESSSEHHHHVRLTEITDLLKKSGISAGVMDIALKIFTKIAEAEGKVHGIPPAQVHFHELGAVDSIIDVVTAAVCIDYLKPDQVVFSPIYEGCGFVKCAHGRLPVPVPATAELLRGAGAPIVFTGTRGEMVTPTGAGIAAVTGERFGAPCPSGRIAAIGIGAGCKDFDHPNILRTFLIDTEGDSERDSICVLEAQVDDMTGEALGHAMERLFEAGCVDVYYTAVMMKKNRPGVLITALCPPAAEELAIDTMFKHTTTIGLRKRISARQVMRREMLEISTEFGDIPVKKCSRGEAVKYHPEFNEVSEIARRNNLSVNEVLQEVLNKIK